jgi:hypothetical protein
MKKSFIIKCAVIGASLPLLAGCVERQVVYRDRPAPAPVVVDDAPAAPAPYVEVQTMAPGPLAVWFWAPGVWEWHGRWVWTRGHWIARSHPGAEWVVAHWGKRGGHRVWVTGGWR